jgi:hypothetical protein
LSSDNLNCGGCRQTCGAHQMCAQSKCECAVGYADCNGKADDGCEASLLDAKTCGSCSNDCGANTSCTSGGCGCVSDFLDCDPLAAGCETATTNPNHCGVCQRQCTAPAVCNGTACVSGCTAGQTKCNGTSCVDLQTDSAHCGACNKPVGPNQTCVAGKPSCVADFADCDTVASNGCEVDLRTDSRHCGTCITVCKLGAVCSGKACACSASKPNDCSKVGGVNECRECCTAAQCSDGDACTTETCTAAGTCASSASCSNGNKCCGGAGCYECCDNADCPIDKVCSGNQCVGVTCTPPEELCNGRCENLDSSATNCGGCGNVCAAGRSCAARSCTPKWLATPAAPAGFVGRSRAAFAWTGSSVFIWGGKNVAGQALNTGAFYDPSKTGVAAWSLAASDVNAPSARVLATAVWTGSELVVWGGGNAADSVDYSTGSVYDPVGRTWRRMTSSRSPAARRGAVGIWTGSRVLLWGGFASDGLAVDNKTHLYDPANNSWTEADDTNAPQDVRNPATAWSGTHFYVFGGWANPFDTSAARRFQASNETWSPLPSGPSLRNGPFGNWDGSYFVVWGGRQLSSTPTTNGMRYDPGSNGWTSLATASAPSARYVMDREHGWTARVSAGRTLILGGFDPSVTLSDAAARKDGGIYNSTTNSWTAVPAWPSSEVHRFAVAVWMGSEFLLWGGETGGMPTGNGERYLP